MSKHLLKSEINNLLISLMYFTRVPVPATVNFNQHSQQQSLKYFPLIGWMVGALCALVLILSASVWPTSISILLAITAGILITGALHEDGLADCCDGFGGGWKSDQVLEIMKDSNVGAYAVIGLVLILGFKFLLITEIAAIDLGLAALALSIAHSGSRMLTLLIVFKLKYVQSSAQSKALPMVEKPFSFEHLIIAMLFVLIPILLIGDWAIFEALVMGFIATICAGLYFHRRIQGYSGDCLGANQQLTEIVIYMSLLTSWS